MLCVCSDHQTASVSERLRTRLVILLKVETLLVAAGSETLEKRQIAARALPRVTTNRRDVDHAIAVADIFKQGISAPSNQHTETR